MTMAFLKQEGKNISQILNMTDERIAWQYKEFQHSYLMSEIPSQIRGKANWATDT
jgi:hypothetical protein